MKQFREMGKRLVIWGAGSKGVNFLNALKDSGIEYAVDLNTRKQGKYVAEAGVQIVSPTFLKEYQPDIIVIMNPIYKHEIRSISKELGLTAEFMEC